MALKAPARRLLSKHGNALITAGVVDNDWRNRCGTALLLQIVVVT